MLLLGQWYGCSPAAQHHLSISNVPHSFLVTLCCFSQYVHVIVLQHYLLCHCNCCFQKPWPQLHCPPRSVFSYLLDSTQPYSAALSHPYSLFLVYSVTFADCNSGLACSCYVDGRRKPRGAMWFNSQHVIRSIFSLGSDSWKTAASSMAAFSFWLETEIGDPYQQCIFLA